MTKENIDKIAKEVVAADKNDNKNLQLKTLKKKQNDLEKGIENLFNALEQGQAADVITERIQNKRAELAEIVTQIKKEENNQVSLTEDEIKFFLTKLKRFDTTNKVNRKILVNVLVNAVYLYDDRITYVMNVGERTVEITEGLLADIRANSPLFFESSTIDLLLLMIALIVIGNMSTMIIRGRKMSRMKQTPLPTIRQRLLWPKA